MYTVIVTDLYSNDLSQSTAAHQIQKDTISIGRARENDIVIRQTNVSTRHATIELTVDGFVLTDLNSTNGTVVNSKPLHGSIRVFGDDNIEIGGARLKLTGHPALERGGEALPGSLPVMSDSARGGYPDPSSGGVEPLPSAIPAPLPELPYSGPGEGGSLDGLFPFDDSVVLKPGQDRSPLDEINPFPADFKASPEAIPKDLPGPAATGLADKIKQLESRALGDTGGQPAAKPVPVSPSLPETPVNRPPGDLGSSGAMSPFPVEETRESIAGGNTPVGERAPNLADKIKAMESRAVAGRGDVTGSVATSAQTPRMPESSTPKALDLFAAGAIAAPTATSATIVVEVQDFNSRASTARQVQRFAQETVLLGRGPGCDLVFANGLISSRHAQLENLNGRAVVRDLGSSNGTFVNEVRISQPTYLASSDVVMIGHIVLSVRLETGNELTPGVATGAPHATSADIPPASIPTDTPPALIPTDIPPAPIPATDTGASGGDSASAVAPQASPRGAVFEDFQFDTNFFAVAGQLESAHRLLSACLRDAHDLDAEPTRVWELCDHLAGAIARLHQVKSKSSPFAEVLRAVDLTIACLKNALKLIVVQPALESVHDDIAGVLGLLAPLASSNDDRRLGLSYPPVFSVLRELYKERSKLHGFESSRDAAAAEPVEHPSIRFTLKAGFEYLDSVRGLARSLAEIYFLDELQATQLENVLDEACTNSMVHGYESQGGGFVHLTMSSNSDNQLIIDVDDEGMPIDVEQANSGANDGLGLLLMKSFCNEVQFIDRGHLGKRVRLKFQLPERFSGIFSAPKVGSAAREVMTSQTKTEIHFIGSERAVDISKCLYRARGAVAEDSRLALLSDIKDRLSSGRQISALAYTEQGTSVGHLPVYLDAVNDKYGELGPVVTVPELANGSLASLLTKSVVEKCRGTTLEALGAIVSADHPYEQAAFSAIGGVATGILLGFSPRESDVAGAQGSRPGGLRRTSSVLMHLALRQGETGTVFAPAAHAPIFEEIYRALSLTREIQTAGPEETDALPAISEFVVDGSIRSGVARIQVRALGDDFVGGLRRQMHGLVSDGYKVIYLDLPVEHPACHLFFPEVFKMRYIFAGLIPGTARGDILRLQYTHHAPCDMDACHVDGALGQMLKQHIAREHAAVWG